MPWHPGRRQREGGSEGSGAPARLEAAAPCQVPGARSSGSVAGNEVGITGARTCALPLCSAHLCARSICGNIEVPWWRGCGCFPGGQGVAGSKELKSARAALDPRSTSRKCAREDGWPGLSTFTGAPRVYPFLGREAAFCAWGTRSVGAAISRCRRVARTSPSESPVDLMGVRVPPFAHPVLEPPVMALRLIFAGSG